MANLGTIFVLQIQRMLLSIVKRCLLQFLSQQLMTIKRYSSRKIIYTYQMLKNRSKFVVCKTFTYVVGSLLFQPIFPQDQFCIFALAGFNCRIS